MEDVSPSPPSAFGRVGYLGLRGWNPPLFPPVAPVSGESSERPTIGVRSLRLYDRPKNDEFDGQRWYQLPRQRKRSALPERTRDLFYSALLCLNVFVRSARLRGFYGPQGPRLIASLRKRFPHLGRRRWVKLFRDPRLGVGLWLSCQAFWTFAGRGASRGAGATGVVPASKRVDGPQAPPDARATAHLCPSTEESSGERTPEPLDVWGRRSPWDEWGGPGGTRPRSVIVSEAPSLLKYPGQGWDESGRVDVAGRGRSRGGEGRSQTRGKLEMWRSLGLGSVSLNSYSDTISPVDNEGPI